MKLQGDLFNAPTCHRCGTPLMWRSTETVQTPAGDQLMDVFECPACEQLAARPNAPKTKAA